MLHHIYFITYLTLTGHLSDTGSKGLKGGEIEQLHESISLWSAAKGIPGLFGGFSGKWATIQSPV